MKLPANSLRYLTWLAALGLAAWVLAQLPLSAFPQTAGRLSPAQWLGWITLNLAIIMLLAGRWLVLTRAMALRCEFGQLLRVRQAGQLISFVTPGPQFGGEPLQVYWLWKKYAVPGPSAFLAVGLDRFYELWINFAVLLLAVLALLASASVSFVDWQALAVILLGLVLAMSASAWVLVRQPAPARTFIRRLTRPWRHHPRLRQLGTHWEQLNESLKQVITRKRPALGLALGLSLLAWAGMIAEFWLLLEFVDVSLSLTGFLFLFTVLRLAFLVPLPGGIGSVEAGMLWAFQALALPLPAAAGLILLMRLRDAVILAAAAAVLPGLQSALPPAAEQGARD